jgi:hypothetical protein
MLPSAQRRLDKAKRRAEDNQNRANLSTGTCTFDEAVSRSESAGRELPRYRPAL